METTPIRVLVVDDQAIVRKGICALLAEIDDIEVIGEAFDGQSAIEQAAALEPDVILMDLMMPGMNGIEATRHITHEQSRRVLALTSFVGDDQVFPAIKAGALGYLLKDSMPDDLLRAIRQVHQGNPALHPTIARKVLYEMQQPSPAPPTPDPLSERELDVLHLVAQGYTNREVAEQLVVTEATVRSHVSNILRKLQLANRVQATLYALQEGLVALEDTHLPET